MQKEEFEKVLDALSSPIRVSILKNLHIHGALSYTELIRLIGMDSGRDAGKFVYHLKLLVNAYLIEFNKKLKKYVLTDLARLILPILFEVEDFLARKSRRMYVRTSRMAIEEFDRDKITKSLIKEAGVPAELARKIAEEAERRLFSLQVKYLTAPLIREFVNALLIEKGLEEYRHKLTRLGLPVYDVTKSIELAEKDRLTASYIYNRAASSVLEEYVLLDVLPRDIADLHLGGSIHICNADKWILGPDEVWHDLRSYFYGYLPSSESYRAIIHSPLSLSSALTQILNIIEATNYEVAVAQNIEYFNVLLAPFLEKVPMDKLRELIKSFIEHLSSVLVNNPAKLFVNLGFELEIPDFLKNERAIGPGGKVVGAYGDFADSAIKLLNVFIEAVRESKWLVYNPCIFIKIRSLESINNWLEICELSTKYGLPYFVNLVKGEIEASYSNSCARLDNKWSGDWELDILRAGVVGSVVLNLPRIAYEAQGDDSIFMSSLEKLVESALRALTIKREIVARRLDRKLLPILSSSMFAETYFRLKNSSSLVSIVGLNESVKFHTGRFIHEDKHAYNFAKSVLSHINGILEERAERVLLSQTSDDYAAERLARLDIEQYGRARVKTIRVKEYPIYTTTPIIVGPNGPDINRQLELEGAFHALFNGGHIFPISAEIDERDHLKLFERICRNTEIGCFTFNKLLSFCPNCRKLHSNYRHKCEVCNSSNIIYYRRISSKLMPSSRWPTPFRGVKF